MRGAVAIPIRAGMFFTLEGHLAHPAPIPLGKSIIWRKLRSRFFLSQISRWLNCCPCIGIADVSPPPKMVPSLSIYRTRPFSRVGGGGKGSGSRSVSYFGGRERLVSCKFLSTFRRLHRVTTGCTAYSQKTQVKIWITFLDAIQSAANAANSKSVFKKHISLLILRYALCGFSEGGEKCLKSQTHVWFTVIIYTISQVSEPVYNQQALNMGTCFYWLWVHEQDDSFYSVCQQWETALAQTNRVKT